jgi:NAD(P)H-quinone oxidoreductase subunit 5
MSTPNTVLILIGMLVIAAPLSLVILLGLTSLVDRPFSEQTTTKILQAGTIAGLLAALAVLAGMLIMGTRFVPIELGNWVTVPGLYHFSLKFVFDRLSVPFVILSFVLSGAIGAFGSRYLHRERGFNRFFVLYTIFLLGMVITSLAGTSETLFTGWELVGLSSALLVGYYQSRPAPARNGLWVWSVYRVSDAALLLAVVVMHHLRGEGDFNQLLGTGDWPYEQTTISENQALLVGGLFLLAVAGKSALIPFSGWLPRAMEGPTPSSAIFYGALSVHLGVYLLLRISPLIACSPLLATAVVVLGLTTSLFAYLAGNVQTDIKSALSYASLTQVGLIVAEIGLAHYIPLYVPLVHVLGHACLRTLQFLRAPTLLHDYHTIENAIGDHLPHAHTPLRRLANGRALSWLYRLAIERGYFDALLASWIVGPFVRVFRWCDALERRWTDFLSGGSSRESDRVAAPFGVIDEIS